MSKKERRLYTGTKSIDRTCRNHGSCKWCRDNRTYQRRREMERTEQEIKEAEDLYNDSM